MMKLAKQLILGSTALMCVFASSQASAAYVAGDLLLSFRKDGDTTNTLVFDLGTATNYRDGITSGDLTSIIGNIGAALSSVSGWSDWATNSSAYHMSVLGGATPGLTGDGTNNGGAPTISHSLYASMAGTGSATDTGFATIASNAGVGIVSGAIDGTYGLNGFAANFNALAGTNGTGSIISQSTNNDYAAMIAGTEGGAGPNFGLSASPETTINGTLDLFRILGNTTGAINSAGLGVSQYQGAFVLNTSTGALSFTPDFVVAAPEPSRVVLLGLGLSGLLMRRRRKA